MNLIYKKANINDIDNLVDLKINLIRLILSVLLKDFG